MTREVKLQIVVAFLTGVIVGVFGIVLGGTCIACKNGRELDAAQRHIQTLDEDVTSHHQRLLKLEGNTQ